MMIKANVPITLSLKKTALDEGPAIVKNKLKRIFKGLFIIKEIVIDGLDFIIYIKNTSIDKKKLKELKSRLDNDTLEIYRIEKDDDNEYLICITVKEPYKSQTIKAGNKFEKSKEGKEYFKWLKTQPYNKNHT